MLPCTYVLVPPTRWYVTFYSWPTARSRLPSDNVSPVEQTTHECPACQAKHEGAVEARTSVCYCSSCCTHECYSSATCDQLISHFFALHINCLWLSSTDLVASIEKDILSEAYGKQRTSALHVKQSKRVGSTSAYYYYAVYTHEYYSEVQPAINYFRVVFAVHMKSFSFCSRPPAS